MIVIYYTVNQDCILPGNYGNYNTQLYCLYLLLESSQCYLLILNLFTSLHKSIWYLTVRTVGIVVRTQLSGLAEQCNTRDSSSAACPRKPSGQYLLLGKSLSVFTSRDDGGRPSIFLDIFRKSLVQSFQTYYQIHVGEKTLAQLAHVVKHVRRETYTMIYLYSSSLCFVLSYTADYIADLYF